MSVTLLGKTIYFDEFPDLVLPRYRVPYGTEVGVYYATPTRHWALQGISVDDQTVALGSEYIPGIWPGGERYNRERVRLLFQHFYKDTPNIYQAISSLRDEALRNLIRHLVLAKFVELAVRKCGRKHIVVAERLRGVSIFSFEPMIPFSDHTRRPPWFSHVELFTKQDVRTSESQEGSARTALPTAWDLLEKGGALGSETL